MGFETGKDLYQYGDADGSQAARNPAGPGGVNPNLQREAVCGPRQPGAKVSPCDWRQIRRTARHRHNSGIKNLKHSGTSRSKSAKTADILPNQATASRA